MSLPLFGEAPELPPAVSQPRRFKYPNRHPSIPSHVVTVSDGHRSSGQVSIRCTCPAFKYSRWQECWHVKDVAEKEQLFTVIGGCLVNYPGDRP